MRCTVLGAGSWGTALAIQFARAGHPTVLWGRDTPAIDEICLARSSSLPVWRIGRAPPWR